MKEVCKSLSEVLFDFAVESIMKSAKVYLDVYLISDPNEPEVSTLFNNFRESVINYINNKEKYGVQLIRSIECKGIERRRRESGRAIYDIVLDIDETTIAFNTDGVVFTIVRIVFDNGKECYAILESLSKPYFVRDGYTLTIKKEC